MPEVETFFAAWGMAEAGDRTSAIREAVASDVSYADPRLDAPLTGADAISDYAAMFSQSAPGATAVVVKEDSSHGMARVTVAFRMPNGMEQHGQYFIEPSEGPIARMVGFVGTGAPE